MQDNGSQGSIIFDTEAQTLSTANHLDCGNFDDMLLSLIHIWSGFFIGNDSQTLVAGTLLVTTNRRPNPSPSFTPSEKLSLIHICSGGIGHRIPGL